jgi:DNA-directed RNA polymerase subunit M/transcription elongation factor TFIIS|tara:strand:- start:389 stop:730 length:342 start_codon:yes stop_codon:yes gene_type:complete
MFCGKCGSLGYWLNKETFFCDKCCDDEIATADVILINTKGTIDVQNKSTTHTGMQGKREYEVVKEVERPTTDAYECPKCLARKATCELRQMDQTDEPEVAFIHCQACGYGWRQ